MSASDARPGERTLARAAWNLRVLGLFLLGPVVGILLGSAEFGMPTTLVWIAGGVFLFSLSMFAILVRGEGRRLSRSARGRPTPP